MNLLTKLKVEMFKIVEDPKASTFARIEAGKVVAACAGILLPDTSEHFLNTKQTIELRQAKQAIVEKMLRRKERIRLENRRQYLKRKIRQTTTKTAEKGHDETGSTQE